jgi:hypothetical protein
LSVEQFAARLADDGRFLDHASPEVRLPLSRPDDVFPVTEVADGQLDDDGETVLLSFRSDRGPVRLALPIAELTALLSVCVGLTGQALPDSGETEHLTIPVDDWRVGVTGAESLVLGLAPEAGGALAFHLTRRQAREMAAALSRGVELTAPGAAIEPLRGRSH